MPVVSTMRRTTSRIGSPAYVLSMRSSPASSANRSSASGEYAASPGSSSASLRAGSSAGSMPSAISVSWSPIEALSVRPRRPASSAARSLSSRRSRGPIAQRGPVSSVSTAALAVTSWSSSSIATISATSGSLSRPESPTISTGMPAPVRASKTASAVLLSRVSTPMSDHASRVWAARTSSASHWQLLVLGLEHVHPDPAVGRSRLGLERRDHRQLGVERRGQGVGYLEDAAVGTTVDRQGQHRHRPTVAGREGLGEVEDVGHRGAAPAVDGLVGVTDRGHGVAAPPVGSGTREQAGQHPRLRHRGVLVLVEQHDPEAITLQLPDLRLLLGQPGTQGDLVGEVHQAEVCLEADGRRPPAASARHAGPAAKTAFSMASQ